MYRCFYCTCCNKCYSSNCECKDKCNCVQFTLFTNGEWTIYRARKELEGHKYYVARNKDRSHWFEEVKDEKTLDLIRKRRSGLLEG